MPKTSPSLRTRPNRKHDMTAAHSVAYRTRYIFRFVCSSFGYSIFDFSCSTNMKLVPSDRIKSYMSKALTVNMLPVGMPDDKDAIYEFTLNLRVINYMLPYQISFQVLQVARVMLLSFYYDFFSK